MLWTFIIKNSNFPRKQWHHIYLILLLVINSNHKNQSLNCKLGFPIQLFHKYQSIFFQHILTINMVSHSQISKSKQFNFVILLQENHIQASILYTRNGNFFSFRYFIFFFFFLLFFVLLDFFLQPSFGQVWPWNWRWWGFRSNCWFKNGWFRKLYWW